MIPEHLWVYRARQVRVIDGDSIVCIIDCGFGLHLNPGSAGARLRLLGVDSPERNEAGWAEARQFTIEWLLLPVVSDMWPLRIQTEKADNFGRYLANVWRVSDGAHLNADLLTAGHAVVYGG